MKRATRCGHNLIRCRRSGTLCPEAGCSGANGGQRDRHRGLDSSVCAPIASSHCAAALGQVLKASWLIDIGLKSMAGDEDGGSGSKSQKLLWKGRLLNVSGSPSWWLMKNELVCRCPREPCDKSGAGTARMSKARASTRTGHGPLITHAT